MGDLSKHFSTWEFRCRCGEYRPGPHSVEIKWALVQGLEDLRERVRKPIYLLNGKRCPEHNRDVGGTKGSFHLTGEAGDIVIPGMAVRSMFYHARQIDCFRNGGIGVYLGEGFIHVDVREGKARWARLKKGGPYTGIPKELY